MKLSTFIEKANKRAMSLYGLKLKNDERSRVACALFAIAQEHYNAMLILLQNKQPLNASSFALFRPLFETVMRGLWTLYCASDEQVRNIIDGNKKQLDMAAIFLEVGKMYDQGINLRKMIYDKHWKVLSAYTHSYEQQVQRWLAAKDIESNYTSEEIEELIIKAEIVANIAFLVVKSLESNPLE